VATASERPDVERLFALGRARAGLPPRGRERTVELVVALAFLAAAASLALLGNSPRSLDLGTMGILVGAYVAACQAKFDIADGYTVPTELVLVPMLFLLPTEVVPLLVSVSWALGRLIDYWRGSTSAWRAFHAFADCWHSVGPALVILVAGAEVFSWSQWPVYLLALLAQFAFDFAATTLRAALIDGASPGSQLRLIWPVYLLDAALAPIGLLAAFGALKLGPGVALLVLPLAAVLSELSKERQKRVDHAVELGRAYQGTALLLGDVINADDAYTGSHSRAVVELALTVCGRLGLDARQRRNVEFAALLHDVGKITVPNEIINKPGPLDDAEWEVMRRHTIEGQQMLERVGGTLAEVGHIVRSSHEHYDGGGYPDRLAGEEIPIEARIVTCCDAFSAMTTNRAYRPAMSVDDAVAELRACSGTQFDPRVVDALIEMIDAGLAV
jgi:putative nucleotidyltransferase with HDIG domain